MATIKSYTDLEQSKKLAKVLPLESADMFYNEEPEDETYPKDIVDTEYPMVIRESHKHLLEEYGIPCWSLAALLYVIPERIIKNYYAPNLQKENGKYSIAYGDDELLCIADNPVDACVAMIEKLNELNLL